MASPFEFPKIHSFPPFYTKQPNATILANQLESWCNVIVAYCRHYRISRISREGDVLHLQIPQLDVKSLPPLFLNPAIDRACSTDFCHVITSHLVNTLHHGEYVDPKSPGRGLYVFFYSLERWGDILYQHIADSGQLGTIFTIFELTHPEHSAGPLEIHNMDPSLLGHVLRRVLVKQGKANLLMGEDNEIGGVKFL